MSRDSVMGRSLSVQADQLLLSRRVLLVLPEGITGIYSTTPPQKIIKITREYLYPSSQSGVFCPGLVGKDKKWQVVLICICWMISVNWEIGSLFFLTTDTTKAFLGKNET